MVKLRSCKPSLKKYFLSLEGVFCLLHVIRILDISKWLDKSRVISLCGMRKSCVNFYNLVKGQGIYNTAQPMTFVTPALLSGILYFAAKCTEHVVDPTFCVTSTAVQLHLGIWMCSQVVLDASKLGLSLKGNHTTDGFWKFTSSAVFAATVVTTIGNIFCYLLQYLSEI